MDVSAFYSASARLMRPSEIRKLAHLANRPGIISLAGGMPSAETFPMDVLRELLAAAHSRSGTRAFQYGVTRGKAELVEWLREFMRTRGVRAKTEEMMLTSGSQQGLHLCAQVLLSPGDVALVELPSYIGGITALRNTGAEIIGVLQDDDGIVTELLEGKVRSLQAQGRRVKLLYLIPNFQNPSGVSLTTARRREVLEIARRYDFLILEDDPYYELHFGDAPNAPTIKSMDEEGRVVYLSSFSKILAPGLRTAWLCADPKLASRIEIAKEGADLCSSTFDQEVVYGYCTGGHFANAIGGIREFYYKRREVAVVALRQHMPQGVTWTEPRGGFFIWVRLPLQIDSEAMFSASLDRGVAYVVGHPFHADGSGRNTMRLAYSKESPENLQRGIGILSELVAERVQAVGIEAEG